MNNAIHVPMHDPNELDTRGKLPQCDRGADLTGADDPVLVIRAEYDTMDPAYLGWIENR